MPLKDHDKRQALANKYGWRLVGWAADLDNPAGITLQSTINSLKFLRFQHRDSLKKWETTLKANVQKSPPGLEPPKPIDHSLELVQIPRAALDQYYEEHKACEFIASLEPGSRGAYGKFKEAQARALEALRFTHSAGGNVEAD